MSKRRSQPNVPQQPGPAVAKQPRRRKVAIIGFTPSREQAPYGDKDYEIWGLNALFRVPGVPRADRWFDLHPVDKIPEDRIKWYAEQPIPIYLQQLHPAVPKGMVFPRAEILERFGENAYFTNSISWMIALAMMEGMTHIEVYGVDMSTPDEYRTQRPNVEYWLGLAMGAGIEVKVAETSDLLKATHEYGYGDDGGLRAKVQERIKDFTSRVQQCDKAIAQHGTEIRRLELTKATLEGARQDANWFIQSWGIFVGGSEEGRTFAKPPPDAPAQTVTEAPPPPTAKEAKALAAEVREMTDPPDIEPIDAVAEDTPMIGEEDEVAGAPEFDDMGIAKEAAVAAPA